MAWRTLGLPLVLSLILALPVNAQVVAQRLRDDVPAITHLLPAGLERGKTAEVTIYGERLEGLERLVGPAGVKLGNVASVESKAARVTIDVASDAPPGIHACYFLTKNGLSNPKLIRIDPWPQTLEQEGNNRPSEANSVSFPGAVNGVLAAADQDWFRFEAVAGQRLVFEVLGQRVGSPLRPVLTLFDAAGRELPQQATAHRDIAPDTRLVYTFREAGNYLLRLHDLTYAGADFAVYQLRIGPIAFATAMFPLGAQRGTKVPVTFSGGTLEQPVIHQVDLTADTAWPTVRLQVPYGDDLLSAPALFAAGDVPEASEAEPNDETPQAQSLAWPVTMNGRVDRAGDRDVFRFHATAGSKLALRVAAQQLGSPLDAVVTITDGSGKELLTIDDRQPVPRDPPVVRVIESPAIDDPMGEFTAVVEGDYWLTIEDRYGGGGADYGYRLELAPAVADFELVVQPTDAGAGRAAQPQRQNTPAQPTYAGVGSGSLSLDRGGAGSLVVRAFRNGYNGPIQLSVEGLPAGVQASPATIAAGQNEATINLTADFAAASTATAARVVGAGVAEGSMSAPRRLALQPVVLASLPGNGGLQRYLADVAVGVSQRGAELAIQASLAAAIFPGSKGKVKVVSQRREGYAGAIELKLLNLPTGLSASTGQIAADQAAGEIELTAGDELTSGAHHLLVEGTMRVAEKKEPVVAMFPLDFEVSPLATVDLAQQQVDLPLTGSVTLELGVRRGIVEPASIELLLAGLPKGVVAKSTTIEPGVERFELTLTTAEGAAASPIRRIVQIKPRLKAGERTIELPTLRFALRVSK
ncbi:MAG TPA: hypothetical protein VG125_29730 [Pirellulales bacterium]|jgi:hypothetical protein|nr:hypothetical protein [Pirellulales bacterium]